MYIANSCACAHGYAVFADTEIAKKLKPLRTRYVEEYPKVNANKNGLGMGYILYYNHFLEP